MHTHAPVSTKQEKLPAEEEVREVAPGVLRAQLPINLPGLGHVNCYILEDDKGIALVDPGLPGPTFWMTLNKRLKSAGLSAKRVHTVVVTHSHPDHYGASEMLRRTSGAELVTYQSFKTWWDPAEEDDTEKELARSREAQLSAIERLQELRKNWRLGPNWKRQTPWGGAHPMPPRKVRAKYVALSVAGRRFLQPPRPSRRVVDGEVLRLGGKEWLSVYTPGHTIDHLCLFEPNDGVFMTGDHLLPNITPHISGLTTQDDALKSFFDSLERTHDMSEIKIALPAHGNTFTNVGERVRDIQRHHRERLQLLRDAAADLHEGTVEQFSQRLFKPVAWGPMADSETFAHLEHLRLTGEATCKSVDGELRFTIV
ncbi:MAG: MBL fold metallo-hydrolase [Acidimicrobiales bacterium]